MTKDKLNKSKAKHRSNVNLLSNGNSIKKFKFLYTNCDSFLNKKNELESRLAEESFDFIALTEIFPKVTQSQLMSAEFNLNGFQLFLPSDNLNSGRGVAIYVKKEISASLIDLDGGIFQESVWIETVTNGSKLLFGCIYRSPSGSITNNNNLCSLFNLALNRSFTDIIIVGDFNYKEIKWELGYVSNEDRGSGQTFFDSVNDLFLHQHVTEFTRFREGQNPSLLDLIFTYQEETVGNV